MTYQIVINRIKEIINAHPFIQTYGYGSISDIAKPDDEKAPNYPYAFINPVSTNVTQHQFEATFNLIVMTQVKDKEDDELFGQSNCMKYINDILSQFVLTSNDPLMNVTFPVNMTPFKERFQDDVVGATALLTIRYGQAMSVCDSPITNLDPSVPYCPQSLVIDGDNTQHYLDPGDTYECINAFPPDGIAYSRPNTVNSPQYIVGDQGYQFANNLLPYNEPPVYPETFQTLPRTNTYDNRYQAFALLKYDNEFGNKYRWTNTAGGRGTSMNQSFSQPMFHYMNDWNGAVKGYVIDHLTGLAWTAYGVNPPNGVRSTQTYSHGGQTYTRAYYTYSSFANYAHGLNGETQFELGGYKDWRVPTFEEIASISTWMTGTQMSFAWGVPGWGWDFEALQRWYVTLGQTGNPPRSGGAMWGSSVWNGAPLIANTYFYTNQLPNSTNAGCLVRNHY